MAVDVSALQAQLALAQAAKQKLLLGQNVVEIRHGQNELMKFTPANIGNLNAWIAELIGQLNAAGVPTPGGRMRAQRVRVG